MKTVIVLILSALCLSAQPSRPWSVRIGSSFIALHPDTIVYPDEAKSRRWNYEQGLMMEAFYQLWRHTGTKEYLSYVRKNLDHYIAADGSIRTYELTEFNIDNVTPGRAALRMYAETGAVRYRAAADTVRRQLALHPRTAEGGFWHKKIYPFQMWLDGLYMAEPFYALYAETTRDTALFDDIVRQFRLIERHTRDTLSGLYVHGYDESRNQRWADPVTGRSPNFWGRSLGWYAMAMVDVLDHLPRHHPYRPVMERSFRRFMESVLRYRDEGSAAWYQVVDRPGAAGNYLEASASAMFTYAFAKGVNAGLLPVSFAAEARRSFDGLVKRFVTVDPEGRIFLHDVCRVAGLGGNPYRDGSYEYYISEPRRTNDFKGYGPFLLAAIEVERLTVR
ncbi:MAG: glycoside hydrolase family 88 protein [Bacteroidetes bacterium]|nr:MAG: glycoside hydrolase family 88 protein [Bacteroidota bacterium]